MAGYSATPLAKKLGLADGMRALLFHVPYDQTEIKGFAGFAEVRTDFDATIRRAFDYIHVFETERAALEALIEPLRSSLLPHGMIWISWPKKASKVPTTITEDTLRTLFLPTGLVDVKVAAIDDVWSGLKFMFRKEIRQSL